MYKGKYENEHSKAKAQPVRRKAHKKSRLTAIAIASVMLLTLAIGGTVAWLITNSSPITNTFTPSTVACSVTENFNNGTGEKTNVNVQNTGDTEAYIRVKLVTYRTNDLGQHIGGTATIPTFTPGANWKEYDGYYYYTLPVAPSQKPDDNLINSIQLTGNYDDADGGKQAIDVMAEAIQSAPAKAIGESWGVTISEGSVTPYSG